MNEMIHYIFGTLKNSEATLRAITKTLRKQRSFNRNLRIWAVIATASVAIHELEIRNIRGEIENLKTEIKELRQIEGD